MKHGVTFLILVLILAGFGNGSKLHITDLKFADFDKEAIKKNKVDTVFMISEDYTLNLGRGDTFGCSVYDSKGNLEWETKREFWGHFVKYYYDSNELVKRKDYITDFRASFGATYKFVADSQVLYQYWAGADTDTCVFRFNKDGRLIGSNEYANDDHGRGTHYEMKIEYDTLGRVVKSQRLLFTVRGEFVFDWQKENSTLFYYSNSRLDSTVTIIPVTNSPKHNETITNFYNDNGLRDSTVAIGAKLNTRFKNPETGNSKKLRRKEAMGILVTRYAYKFRHQ